MNKHDRKYVRGLVEEVINKLIISGRISICSSLYNKKIYKFCGKLITANDVKIFVKNKFECIQIKSNTIITPLANDEIKKSNIRIEHEKTHEKIDHSQNDNRQAISIAVLSNNDDIVYKNKTKNILQKLSYEVECLDPKNFIYSELENSTVELSKNIKKGKYKAGIVISENSYELMKNLKNVMDINTKICWELNGDKVCSERSNILFINSNLIGFKMLEEKINSWIDINRSEN